MRRDVPDSDSNHLLPPVASNFLWIPVPALYPASLFLLSTRSAIFWHGEDSAIMILDHGIFEREDYWLHTHRLSGN